MIKSFGVSISIVVVIFAAAYPFYNFQPSTQKHQQEEQEPVIDSSDSNLSNDNKRAVSKVKIKNENLPDFSAIKDVKTKKSAFFSFLKPFVIQINDEIRVQREFVQQLDSYPVEQVKLQRLNKLSKYYGVSLENDFSMNKSELLLRIDELPISLVLMQAANESAWGTSRFALLANNLFGQWCFKSGCGVVPEGRPEGKTYEVRKFAKPIDSIRSYFHNINTGHAYDELRELRRSLRELNEPLDATILAEGLTKYSIRREAYVEEIQNMIRINQKYI